MARLLVIILTITNARLGSTTRRRIGTPLLCQSVLAAVARARTCLQLLQCSADSGHLASTRIGIYIGSPDTSHLASTRIGSYSS